MCRVLQVSRAGFYKWRARPLSARAKADAVLARADSGDSHAGAGARMAVRACIASCGRRGFGGGEARRARHARTRAFAHGAAAVSGDDRSRAIARRSRRTSRAMLWRRAQPGPDRVWAADITYIPTREGWLYLAVVLDLASRRVVGWAVRTRLDQRARPRGVAHGAAASRGPGRLCTTRIAGCSTRVRPIRRLLMDAGSRRA